MQNPLIDEILSRPGAPHLIEEVQKALDWKKKSGIKRLQIRKKRSSSMVK
jgi:hypothetical protein